MTLVHRPTYRCDGCGTYAAHPWRTLRFDLGWRMLRCVAATLHFCAGCVKKGWLNR